MAAELYHDPVLAKEIHRAYVEIYNRKPVAGVTGAASYNAWLEGYVRPLAEALGIKIKKPPRQHTRIASFKAPEELLKKLDKLSQELGVSRSELIRKAIEIFIEVAADA